MRLLLLPLLWLGLGLPAGAAEAPSPPPAQATGQTLPGPLAAHLREEVPYWLDEPRLYLLLREHNARNAALDAATLATLESRWQAELDAGAGELGDRLASRFASKYFAEVALRVGAAYGLVLALDRQGVLVAASELPEHYVYTDLPAWQALAADPRLPYAVDEGAVGRMTRVLLPIREGDDGELLGTLVLEVNAARLAGAGSLRAAVTGRQPRREIQRRE